MTAAWMFFTQFLNRSGDDGERCQQLVRDIIEYKIHLYLILDARISCIQPPNKYCYNDYRTDGNE